MQNAIEILQYVAGAGFILLGVAAVVQWRREGGRAAAIMAGAIGLIGVVSLLGRIGELTDYRYRVLFDVSLVGFLASGFLLLEFRHEFLPLPKPARIGMLVLTAGVAAFTVARQLEYGPDPRYTSLDSVALLAVLVLWAVSVIEPIVQFWRAAGKRPTVQRARLRALAGFYGGIILILVVGVSFGSDADDSVSLGLQITALALLPMLYVAIAPPRLLRRLWRAPEEEALRASRDLVMFAPDRRTLATRALEWAARLVGGEAAFIATQSGDVIAERRMAHDEACDHAARLRGGNITRSVPLLGRGGRAIVAPVRTELGVGALVVLSGPFVQLFGSDELLRLGEYADEIGVALDRVHLTEEMRRLDEARRAFIANAAHELRTPLTAILGFSSMLADDPVRFTPERLQQATDAIHRHALRMRTLVNNLLDLTQIEQGRLTLHLEPVSLKEVTHQALESAPAPDERERALTVAVPDLPVLADRLRLEQVLANLLTNAFKYGGDTVAVAAYPDGDSVLFEVVDDGPGIPDRLKPRLFEPFVRGAAVGKEGSGLGLAIVRSLVRAFGGEIWYEDVAPHGARFVLRLRSAP